MQSSERYWRTVALATLALCALLTADRMLRVYFLSASSPREVVIRSDLPRDEKRTAEVFKATSPSVVAIHTLRGSPHLDADGGGAGSGFVWDRADHIVTNDHVIDGATDIIVGLDDGRALPATFVGRAPWADLAFIPPIG